MPRTFRIHDKRASLLVSVIATLLLSTSARSVTSLTSTAVLQNCPNVEEEIVDLEMLADALSDTRAVGLIEKIRLKRSIDGMVRRFQAYHDADGDYSLEQLEEQYNTLLMRIASHLQHKDQILHQQLCNAWLLIWQDLEDSGRFSEKFNQ